MSASKSFQLPDLLTIIEPLELRTNRHCKSTTDASAAWAAAELNLTETAHGYLGTAKIGLLAGLCFPKCDAPQLRILTDFMTLVCCAAAAGEERDSAATTMWEAGGDGDTTQEGVHALDGHAVLKRRVTNDSIAYTLRA